MDTLTETDPGSNPQGSVALADAWIAVHHRQMAKRYLWRNQKGHFLGCDFTEPH